MTDRALMQQALEALELEATRTPIPETAAAMAALRAALAEPEPEPVAWINDDLDIELSHKPWMSDVWKPLYTAPPTRRPLTDEEIKLAVLNDPIYGAALMSMMRDGVTVAQLREAVSGIARAIERKITGGNDE